MRKSQLVTLRNKSLKHTVWREQQQPCRAKEIAAVPLPWHRAPAARRAASGRRGPGHGRLLRGEQERVSQPFSSPRIAAAWFGHPWPVPGGTAPRNTS